MSLFHVNFSQTIKSTIKIKNKKVTAYGKEGEISPSGIKFRYYQLFPNPARKYVTIQGVTVKWTPTVAHLLEGKNITIKAKDNRGSDRSSMDLFVLRKSAEKSWEFSIATEIFLPIEELTNGLPISFDIDVSGSSVKSNREIGTIKMYFTCSSCDSPCATTVGPAEFKYDEMTEMPLDFVVWRGMDIASSSTKDEGATAAISSYLKGDINMEKLGILMCKNILRQ